MIFETKFQKILYDKWGIYCSINENTVPEIFVRNILLSKDKKTYGFLSEFSAFEPRLVSYGSTREYFIRGLKELTDNEIPITFINKGICEIRAYVLGQSITGYNYDNALQGKEW